MTLGYILLTAISIIFLFAIIILPGNAPETVRNKFYGRNYAHRGLHTKDQSVPENSLAAFAAAADAGYGMELDIQLSKDDQVVVFHDDNLQRVCGVDKRVDELTYLELQELSLFGTEERIPLLTDVFALVAQRVPIIVEVKTGRKNKLLCKHALDLIKQYPGDVCVESFHPGIVDWFRTADKSLFRGQLAAGAASFRSLPKMQAFMLSNLLTNFNTRPHFIAFRADEETTLAKLVCKIGAMSVVWTVNDTMDYKHYEETHDAVIFEYYRPEPRFKGPDFIDKDKTEFDVPAGKTQYTE